MLVQITGNVIYKPTYLETILRDALKSNSVMLPNPKVKFQGRHISANGSFVEREAKSKTAGVRYNRWFEDSFYNSVSQPGGHISPDIFFRYINDTHSFWEFIEFDFVGAGMQRYFSTSLFAQANGDLRELTLNSGGEESEEVERNVRLLAEYFKVGAGVKATDIKQLTEWIQIESNNMEEIIKKLSDFYFGHRVKK